MPAVNKKIYALIKTSQENAKAIAGIIDGAFANGDEASPATAAAAVAALREIAKINGKFAADFGDVDPGWQPRPQEPPQD